MHKRGIGGRRLSGCVLLLGLATSIWHAVAAQPGAGINNVDRIARLLQTQDFDQALLACDAALKQSPRDKRVWALRGMASTGKGSATFALDSYHHALGLDPAYLPALEGAAQIEYQRRAADAKPLLLRVLAQAPDDPTSHTMLGFLEYAHNDCAAAVPHFAKGGAVIAAQPMALAAYGACLAQAAHYDQAVPILQRALDLDSSTESIRFNLALALWKANKAQDALATLQPAIDAGTSQQDESLILAADIHESTNDTQSAVDLLRKAIILDPKAVDAYLDFAQLSWDHRSMQIGIDMLNAGLTQLPNEARLYLVRGIFYAQLGKFDQAGEDFERANRLDSKLSLLGAVQGLAASQRHQSAEALAAFRAAAKAQPRDALTQYLLAEALSQENVDPGSAGYKEEIAAANKASLLDTSMVAAHDLLAMIYLRTGQNALAIDQCHAALAADPKDQQALFHMIIALRKTGQKDQISTLLQQLAVLRRQTQSEAAQSERYQLQEVQDTTAGP